MSDDVTRLAEVLAEHFVMWHDLPRADKPGALNPSGEWRCSCGLKFSDTAIDHVAQQAAPLIAEARLLGAVQAKSDAIDAHAELVARMEALADEFRDTDPIPGRAVAGLIRAALNDPTEETP